MIDFIVIFIAQIVFLLARTINIKATATGNMLATLVTGGVASILFIGTTTLGVNAVQQGSWSAGFGFLTGGLLGSYIGMILNRRK